MQNYAKIICVSSGIMLSTGVTYIAGDYYPPCTRYFQRKILKHSESKPDILQALIESATLGAFGGISASLILEHILERSRRQ